MKTLYLLRHAHTGPATPPQMSDYDRKLSPQGVKDAGTVGQFMQSHGMKPDHVMHSSAVRTSQTAQLILDVLFGPGGGNPNALQDLYQASDEKLLAAIRRTDDAHGKLMLVAHNPGVADLAHTLGEVKFCDPGTLSVFVAQCDKWDDFSPAIVKLERVFVPESQ
jgi:phosphohistidine phosphatase